MKKTSDTVPELVRPPALSGTGRIGSPVTVALGGWKGDPPPRLSQQWLRGGAKIPGATGTVYTPGPQDDRTKLTCRIRAGNVAGTSEAVTAALAVTYEPPKALEPLWEEVFDQHSGEQVLETRGAFYGENLTFAISGPAARVDPRSGAVTVSTERALSGEIITVQAENSGGSARSTFSVTVESEDADVTVVPSVGLFVDYDIGDDANAGTSDAPLKTLPAALPAGTTAYFRRGSIYRAPIQVISAGTAADPIRLDFETWGGSGDPPGLLDLSEPITGFDGGGTLNGAAVYSGDFPAHLDREGWPDLLLVQQDQRLMGLAQLPTPSRYDKPENLSEWYSYETYSYAGSDPKSPGWREWITAPGPFAGISGSKTGLLLRIWRWGNLVGVYKVIDFDARAGRAEVVPYQHDKPINILGAGATLAVQKFAIINHPDCLVADGQYIVDTANWKIRLRPYDGATPETARFSAAGGIDHGIEIKAPHVEIHGARVRMVASRQGSGIHFEPATDGGSAGLKAFRCEVSDCMAGGAGIYLYGISHPDRIIEPQVEGCRVDNMLGESCRGIFFVNVLGGMIRGCTVGSVTSTGISCYTCEGSRVYGNTSGESAGVHGNGFSFYLGCRDLVVAFNTVHQPAADQIAMTLQSAGRCAIVFNDFLTADGASLHLYGPTEGHAELGGHLIANNNILTAEGGRALAVTTIPVWNEVRGQRIGVGNSQARPGRSRAQGLGRECGACRAGI